MKEFIKGMFTDALGRPEPKNVLGFTIIMVGLISSIIWLAIKQDVGGSIAIFAGFFTPGAGLFVTTAVADAKIDSTPGA